MMDFEAASHAIAELAVSIGRHVDPGVKAPVSLLPEVKSADEIGMRILLGRPLTVEHLHELREKLTGDDADQYGGTPMLKWVTKSLIRIRNQVPVGVTGDPMTWEEATAIEHPFLVATKAISDPSWRHLKPDAVRYMAASPLRSPQRHERPPGEVKTHPDAHTGALVALIPSEEDLDRLEPLATEKRSDLHVTLHYPGDSTELDGKDALHERVAALAKTHDPIDARVAGMAVFNPTGEIPATVLILNHDRLGAVKHDATDAVESTLTGNLVDQHAPWIPHVTLGYDMGTRSIPPEVFDNPLTLDRVRVAWGEDSTDYPLGQ